MSGHRVNYGLTYRQQVPMGASVPEYGAHPASSGAVKISRDRSATQRAREVSTHRGRLHKKFKAMDMNSEHQIDFSDLDNISVMESSVKSIERKYNVDAMEYYLRNTMQNRTYHPYTAKMEWAACQQNPNFTSKARHYHQPVVNVDLSFASKAITNKCAVTPICSRKPSTKKHSKSRSRSKARGKSSQNRFHLAKKIQEHLLSAQTLYFDVSIFHQFMNKHSN